MSCYGCDRELMDEISQLEELDCFPNYILPETMAYSLPQQQLQPNASTFLDVPVQHWTTQNCVEWAEKICYQHSLDKFSVDIGALSNTSGSHLMQLSMQDFCLMLGDYYGQLFYREFQTLTNSYNVRVAERSGRFVSSPELDTDTSVNYGYGQELYDTNFNMERHSQEEYLCSSYTDNSNMYGYSEGVDATSAAMSSFTGDSLNDSYETSFDLESYQNNGTGIFNDDSLDNFPWDDLDSKHSIGMLSVDMGVLNIAHSPANQDNFMASACNSPGQVKIEPNTAERKPRRYKKIPKNVTVSDNTVQELCKMVQGSGKYIRCPKTWEFLVRLLVCSETNPEVICWEDESQYIFRIVDPKKLMELWNAKAGKSSGNYDNFARSLRYHYKKGILIPVPEKQLVYRCGDVAIQYLHQLQLQ